MVNDPRRKAGNPPRKTMPWPGVKSEVPVGRGSEDARAGATSHLTTESKLPMKHAKLIWNLNTKEWFCKTCGRTSDQVSADDARVQLDQHECQVPYVEGSDQAPGEETVRLIKKPFGMVPRKKAE
jgi:hypothetical protein